MKRLVALAGLVGALVFAGGHDRALAQSEGELIARGEYLVAIGGCGDCHTDGTLLGRPNPDLFLAGADNGFLIPELGVVYPTNLTPDPETGLGAWTREDIVRALQEGVRPDGSQLLPPMPVQSTAQLTDEDALAVAAYLESLAPTAHPRPGNPVAVEDAKKPYMVFVFPE